MPCCGRSNTGTMSITQQDIDNGLRLEIEYTGGRTVQVRGSITGSEYVFSGLQRLQKVDPRDAMAILKNQLFRLKGISRETSVNG
jgi:hypothetical protein